MFPCWPAPDSRSEASAMLLLSRGNGSPRTSFWPFHDGSTGQMAKMKSAEPRGAIFGEDGQAVNNCYLNANL